MLSVFETAPPLTCPRRYDPGDVAVIHPVASQLDVDAFLEIMDWSRIADEPVKIVPKMAGEYARRFTNEVIIDTLR